ncbi:hypothetical protein [Ralstonia sp. SET104]|uniref:hypothetical protein n=1 Tax=Ralstonia sp. SET104 TaxID=2448774 RepID=UPI000F57D16B|nr:hypothetical protein [Ralstonia sp. SET104]GCB02631.1 hypothetical protein PSUB009319_02620 [Ralstonia sp. SET104]
MIDFETLKKYLGQRVEISPTTGRPRFADMHNDVMFYVDRFGGTNKTAELLGVSPDEVELWIDEHHVPQPYADRIHTLARAAVPCIQEPWTVVIEREFIWPAVRDPEIQARLNLPPLAEDGITRLDAGRS